MREPAHGLREWPRAMARRGRLLPDLWISAPSGFPRILMGPIYDHRQTEVRLCRWPRTGCRRVGERWRTGAGGLQTCEIR